MASTLTTQATRKCCFLSNFDFYAKNEYVKINSQKLILAKLR